MTDADKTRIERINEISAIARTSWLALLGYLAFIGISLLAVEDADFFVETRRTDLPLVGVAIPTYAFFLFAPILAAALYVYLQVHLLKLWDAIADTPALIDNRPLGEHLHPWIANDYALSLKGNGALRPRPLRRLGNLATRLLVWIAGPAVIAGFWWRSMPAHDEGLTLAIAVALLVSLHAGMTSWWTAHARLRTPWSHAGPWDRWWRRPAGIVLALAVISVSWLRTEGGLYYGVDLDAAVAPMNMRNAKLSDFPSDWSTCATAKRQFRSEFAEQMGLPLAKEWSGFVESQFNVEWLQKRAFEKTLIPSANLSEEDLTFSDFLGATGFGVLFPDLPWKNALIDIAMFDGSKFFNDLSCTLDWGLADLSGMDLFAANLSGANFAQARLIGANLKEARLEGANLWDARLEGADLTGARLVGADLILARLVGANLEEARLEGANLRAADFRKSNWAGASNRASPAQFADFRGVQDLTQDQLDQMIGNEQTLLPDKGGFTIPSCWKTPPDGLDALVERVAEAEFRSADEVRAEFLCPEGEEPRSTGTPLPLDAPYPAGHPLADPR